MSSAKLQGRVAIVTGASRGIGREIAITLASNGASVVVCFQGRLDKANEVVDLIKSKSGNAIAVQVDVSSEADVKALFDKAEEAFGSVHILVNSAGILFPRNPTLEDTTLQEWEQTFAINSRGTFLPSREAANRLVRGGGGRIVNLSTSLVAALMPGYGAYTASKAGIEALTKILTKELRGRKITVNAVAPGPVATDLFYEGKSKESIEFLTNATPLERLGEPKDIAALVLFLTSDDGEWVNGQVIRANGGFAV